MSNLAVSRLNERYTLRDLSEMLDAVQMGRALNEFQLEIIESRDSLETFGLGFGEAFDELLEPAPFASLDDPRWGMF